MSEMAKEELVNRFKGMTEEEKRVVLGLFSLKDLTAEICSRAALYEVQLGKVRGIVT